MLQGSHSYNSYDATQSPTSDALACGLEHAASLVCDASAGHHGTGLRARGHKQAAAGAGSPVPTPGPGQLDGRTPVRHTPSKADLAVSMGASEEY